MKIKFMLKTEKHFYILLFVTSVIFAVAFFILATQNTTPYSLSIKEEIPLSNHRYQTFYRDISSSGVSSKFTLSLVTGQVGGAILFYNKDNLLQNQFNSNYRIEPRFISFHDWNKNGTEELFLFSTVNDSLFLTIIDLVNKKKMLNEQLIISGGNTKKKNWDIGFIKTEIDDVNGDNTNDLIFSIAAGFSLYPRGVFTYDIKNRRMINSFLANAKIKELKLFDIDNDGNNEIIASSSATGNGNPNLKYNDHTSWLFVFNKDLTFKFKPKNYGEYPSTLNFLPINKTDGNYILSAFTYSNKVSKPIKIELVNSIGNIIKKKEFSENIHYNILKYNSNDNEQLLLSFRNGSNLILDNNLNVVKRIKSELGYATFLKEVNLLNDEKSEIIYCTVGKMILLDAQFNILASNSIDFGISIYPNSISTKKTGLKSEKLIAINSAKKKTLFQIKKSIYHSLLPFISIFSFFLFFGALILLHEISKRISRRFRSLDYFVNSSEKGILVIDQNGKVKSFNLYLFEISGSVVPLKINQHFSQTFINESEIQTFINNGLISKKKETQEILISLNNNVNRFRTTIFPMISFLGFPYAYLIELDNITKPIISERQKLWSKTSQKIAHDIKTPLSTIQLNLAALNKRIDKEDFQEKEKFKDDIAMIRSEVNRIRSLTKGFLKFANLEKPNLQIVSIKEIIKKALQQFYIYEKNGVKIATSFYNEDEVVFVDPIQIEQFLHIIVENSIDSMEGKGSIEIKTELAQKVSSEDFLQIEISDNGMGIEEAKVNEIFEPYFTTKKDGTGLGLAIAKKIIEDNNGEISIYSKLGMGTTVTLLLPIVES